MISESQQEQAALYALGLLDAREAAEFESSMDGDDGMRDLARDCLEASACLALVAGPASGEPPQALKDRILRHLEPVAGSPGDSRQSVAAGPAPDAGKVVRFSPWAAIPWALAAMLMVFCGLLAVRQGKLQDENEALSSTLANARNAPTPAAPDLLRAVAFCQMEPAAAPAVAQPRATVAWDAARQEGVLQIVQLTPPASDKDYQLWVVEDGKKEPVSAGLVHVDAQGRAQTVFKPESTSGGGRAVAFALSLEQSGGSPTNAGPILLLGKL